MSEIASAFVSLLPSAKGFGSKLDSQVGGEVKQSGSRLGGIFSKTFMAGAAVIGGAALIGGFLKDSIGEAREAQKVGALTNSVIKATGGAANVTAKQVGNLATSLSLKTGIDDEVIQSGQNMLLTFKNIRNEAGKGNDIFNQTSKTLVDMSAAMGSDPKQAAIQLGKALNDPIKGVSALSRVGVTFTEGQKKTIASLVEGGNVMGAQKIVLKELNSEFGGAAAAQATAGEKASVAVGNLKEQIGTALLPLVDKVEMAFVKATPEIAAAISGIGPAFSQIGAFFAPVVAQIQGFFGGGAGGGVLASLTSFGTTIKANFLPVLQTMAQTFTGTILPAITSLASYLAAKLFPVFTQVAGIIKGQVIPIIASLAQFFYGTLYPAVVKIVSAVASNLKPVFDQLVATFRAKVLPALQQLLAKFHEWQPTIQQVILVVVKIIGKVLEFAAAILGKVLPPVIRFAGFLIGTLVSAIIKAISVIAKIVQAVISVGKQFIEGAKQIGQFAAKVGDKVAEAFGYVKALPGKIKGALSNAATLLVEAGKDVIRGLINGIKSMAGAAADAAKAAVKGALDGAKSLLGIHSPSTKFAEVGMWSMAGLKKGIDDNADAPVKGVAAAMKKVRDQLTSERDKIKGVLDQLKSDFSSLSDSIGSAFTSDMFSAGNAGAFVRDLTKSYLNLGDLKRAFKTLRGWGLDPAFLSQLFASGNSDLILSLADGSKGRARHAGRLFGETNQLANQLGNSVARDVLGPKIDRTNERLHKIEQHLASLPKNIGKELNGAVAHGQRRSA